MALEAKEALSAVRADLGEGFSGIFEEVEELQPVGLFGEDGVGPVGTDGVSVMAWEWKVNHIGLLQGTAATGRQVTLRGVTVIDERRGEPQFSRYIDWLGLYAELGAITLTRPTVDDRSVVPDNVPYPEPDPGTS